MVRSSKIKSFILKHFILIGSVFLWLYWILVFFPLSIYVTALNQFHDIHIFLDDWIPFRPEWLSIYLLTLILPFMPAILIKDRRYYLHAAIYVFMMITIAYICFIVFPVKVRRTVPEISGFFSWGIHLNHFIDKPVNCFPSLHVGIAFGVALALGRVSRLDGIVLFITAILVACSVVFVQAHVLLDVAGGILLSFGLYFLYLRRRGLKKKSRKLIVRNAYALVFTLLIFLAILFTIYIFYLIDLKYKIFFLR